MLRHVLQAVKHEAERHGKRKVAQEEKVRLINDGQERGEEKRRVDGNILCLIQL